LSIRESYQQLRGLSLSVKGYHIIVLNIHAPTKDKTDDVKDSFYEELERAFDKFLKYHTKILLEDFNAKVGREDIFKLTIGNGLHKISNNNGVSFSSPFFLLIGQMFQIQNELNFKIVYIKHIC
jgi:hypothetical protein